MSSLKKIVLALITLDTGGGIISNFTEGTNIYYAESVKKRYLFIAVHILQPLVLSWIFTNNFFAISTLTVYTLISSFIVTTIKQKDTQINVAASMLLVGIILTFFLGFSHQILQLISLVYTIKLILAFSVNWTKQQQ